jgi:hypothetical protein
VDLSAATGISFYHKGHGCQLKLETSDVLDYAYHTATVAEHADWTLVHLCWADFKQPSDWGTRVSLKLAHCTAFDWEVSAADGTTGSLWIDNVRLPGSKNVVTGVRSNTSLSTHKDGFGVSVRGSTLCISRASASAAPQAVSIFDMRGKLVREIRNSGAARIEADLGRLPNGFYSVRVNAGLQAMCRTIMLMR